MITNNHEAIKILKFNRPSSDWRKCGVELCEAVDMAITALEKQIPKKPVLTSGDSLVHVNKGDKPHEWKVKKWQEWCCPVCGWFVGERFNAHRHDGSVHSHDQCKSNYCNECGQAIDWT